MQQATDNVNPTIATIDDTIKTPDNGSMQTADSEPVKKIPRQHRSIRTRQFAVKPYTYNDYMKSKLKRATMKFEDIGVPDDIMEFLKSQQITTEHQLRRTLINVKAYKYLDYCTQILQQLNNPIINTGNSECVICYEMVNTMTQLLCKHKICQTCSCRISIDGCIKCPLCRRQQAYVETLDESYNEEILSRFSSNNDIYKTNDLHYIPFNDIIASIKNDIDDEHR